MSKLLRNWIFMILLYIDLGFFVCFQRVYVHTSVKENEAFFERVIL